MEEVKTIYTDVLVIGSGVAGLRAAAAAAEAGVAVTVLSKGPSASPEIMGFNVPVCPEDSVEQYISDMSASGCGICDERLVRTLAENVVGEIGYLEGIGLELDRDEDGSYNAIHTLGTKYPRLIHYKSNTGSREMALLKRRCRELGVKFSKPVDVLGLLTDGGRVIGAYGMDMEAKTPLCCSARAVVLAAGGCGAMHKISTYPRAIIGDGYAMALRAGAELVDMEFQQFEPCCFVYPEKIEGRVIATTLLRHGAELLNGEGRDFMPDYGLTRENAQKSTLSRAMLSEVRAGRGTPHGGIYYNLTMMSRRFLYEDHAIFTRPAREAGIDLTREMPEMMPAAHTCLGGVRVDESCRTGVEALFACGEVIGGLHGANRIGGSAGAETLVFGALAGTAAAEYTKLGGGASAPEALKKAWRAESERMSALPRAGGASVESIRERLGRSLSENVGIVRSAEGLRRAARELESLKLELESAGAESPDDAAMHRHCENMLLVAAAQVTASAMRRESRGVFYREDFPEQDDENWQRNIVIRLENDGLRFRVAECEKA